MLLWHTFLKLDYMLLKSDKTISTSIHLCINFILIAYIFLLYSSMVKDLNKIISIFFVQYYTNIYLLIQRKVIKFKENIQSLILLKSILAYKITINISIPFYFNKADDFWGLESSALN